MESELSARFPKGPRVRVVRLNAGAKAEHKWVLGKLGVVDSPHGEYEDGTPVVFVWIEGDDELWGFEENEVEPA